MAVEVDSPVRTELSEAPATLTVDAPRTLGLFDQFGFWGNVGVSLLGSAPPPRHCSHRLTCRR